MRYILSFLLFLTFLGILFFGLLFVGIRVPVGVGFPMRSFSPMIIILALVLLPAVLLALPSKSRKSQSGKLDKNEAKLIQEIHQSLSEMERRIDNLETIMLSDKSACRGRKE